MTFMLTEEQLEMLRQTDIHTVNRDELVDISTIQIDTTLPRQERMESYLAQIKNPYCFKCGQMAVKVSFALDGPDLQERLVEHIKSLG